MTSKVENNGGGGESKENSKKEWREMTFVEKREELLGNRMDLLNEAINHIILEDGTGNARAERRKRKKERKRMMRGGGESKENCKKEWSEMTFVEKKTHVLVSGGELLERAINFAIMKENTRTKKRSRRRKRRKRRKESKRLKKMEKDLKKEWSQMCMDKQVLTENILLEVSCESGISADEREDFINKLLTLRDTKAELHGAFADLKLKRTRFEGKPLLYEEVIHLRRSKIFAEERCRDEEKELATMQFEAIVEKDKETKDEILERLEDDEISYRLSILGPFGGFD